MKPWQLASRSLSFDKPVIMGILNITPDSFSDGGKFLDADAAYQQAKKLIEDGSDVLDLGAESTRPGAEPILAAEQIARLMPVLRKTRDLPILLSIDTTSAEVAEACLKEGAHIINDISGLRDSGGKLAEVVARHKAGLILMHRRGNAETMQKLAIYENLLSEVLAELEQSIERAVECGVLREAIVIDPGIGFSKTAEQNLVLIKEIKKLEKPQLPILLGVSRKSFIGKVTGREADHREFGTAACTAYALSQGVRFFRVHDVKATRDVIKMLSAIESAEFFPNVKMGCL